MCSHFLFLSKFDKTKFNKNVRRFAQYGLIYINNYGIESFCPFCLVNNKFCCFKQGFLYSHSNTCNECQILQEIFRHLNNNWLSKIVELCAVSNIFINTLCSIKFNQILQFSNPFFRSLKRNNIVYIIIELFNYNQLEIKTKCTDEFCSILLNGVKRNNKNF